MKKAHISAILRAVVCLFLAGCLPAQPAATGPEAVLTPFFTSTPPKTAAAAPQSTETPQPEPTATSEPLIHEVALQETISSIALRYGVSMDAIIAANPDIEPRTLTVGTRLVIPGVSSAAAFDPGAEPLALEVGDAICLPTPEGGLWCRALVSNPLNRSADGIIVAFTVADESGQALTQNVPALLNRLDPGQALPVVAYFPPPAPRAAGATAELLAALPLETGIREYFELSLQNERVVTQGRSARTTVQVVLSGVDELPAGETLNLWIAAAAYDALGRLLGVRRLERELGAGEISAGESLEVTLLVYSAADEIDSVQLNAEAFILKQ
jgi:LysM repeat protein